MKKAGFKCELKDGVLQFEKPEGNKELKRLVQTMDDIGYHASWGF